jgi:hypothetical protein
MKLCLDMKIQEDDLPTPLGSSTKLETGAAFAVSLGWLSMACIESMVTT